MKNTMLLLIIFAMLLVFKCGWTQNMVLQLDGEDDCVEIFNATSLDLSGPMTIELWYWFS